MASGTYEGVANYEETSQKEVLFDGEPIPHVPYTPTSQDDFEWGYGGAGPTNTARSILEHAVEIADTEASADPSDYQQDFRDAFISSESDDGWTIEHSTVIEFLNEHEE